MEARWSSGVQAGPCQAWQTPRWSSTFCGKSQRPSSQEGGGPEEPVIPRETGESTRSVVGLLAPTESPTFSPLSTTAPFRSAPGPRTPGGRGQIAPLPSLLEGRFGDVPSAAAGRGGLFTSLHVPTTPFIPDGPVHDPNARPSQRRPDRRRGGCPSGEGGHRGGAVASTFARVYQQSLLGSEEKWEDASSHQPEEAECSSPGHTTLQDGDPLGRPQHHPSGGLGGFNRPEGRILSRPHRRRRSEVPALRLERTPIPVLRPPLRPVTRWVPRSVVSGPPVVWAWGGGVGHPPDVLVSRPVLVSLFS